MRPHCSSRSDYQCQRAAPRLTDPSPPALRRLGRPVLALPAGPNVRGDDPPVRDGVPHRCRRDRKVRGNGRCTVRAASVTGSEVGGLTDVAGGVVQDQVGLGADRGPPGGVVRASTAAQLPSNRSNAITRVGSPEPYRRISPHMVPR